MTPFCDICAATLTPAELAACPRWSHDELCDHCADGYADANPTQSAYVPAPLLLPPLE